MNDKRKVSTDALETLGTVIGPNEKRDAIHLAVIPYQAGEYLRPGEHVEVHDRTQRAHACAPGEGVGVVDPFLLAPIAPDSWFWLVIYPRTIHSLRHVWTHPTFPDEVAPPLIEGRVFSKSESLDYLTRVAEKIDVTLEDILDEWRFNLGHFRVDISGNREVPPLFWEHYENATGIKVPEPARTDWFACGC